MKKFLLFLLLFIAAERFCYWQTKGFRVHRVSAEIVHHPEWDFETPPELIAQVAPLVSQDYFFLGHGAQCYAFLSADKSTVLKVFKHPRFRLFSSKDLSSLFESLKIAYEELREETGLIYLHLNKSGHFHKKLTVWDRIGIAHEIDLDSTQFLLQKRAELAPKKLKNLRCAGSLSEAMRCVDALLAHHQLCCDKGIIDRDPVLERNFGFDGASAIEIDLGSFSKDPYVATPERGKKQLFFATLDLKQWIEKNYPELKDYVEEKIRALLAD